MKLVFQEGVNPNVGSKPGQQQQQKPGQAGKQQEEVDEENREEAGDDTGTAGIGT